MKGGQTPIHIQRWAPADLWSDEHWKVLVAKRDYRTMHFYRVFMDHAFMGGGDLPADLEALAAAVHMPRRDVQKALSFCLGRLVFKDGDRLFQRRVRREVKKELRYRRRQSDLGKTGGRPKKKGSPKGTLSDHKSPPAPAPSPAPTPAPSSDASTSAGAERRAGGAVRTAAPSNGGPPAPPASDRAWILDHDPSDPLESRLASRVAHLARRMAERDGEADPLEILKAVSATTEGQSLDHIRGARANWIEPTLRACDRFEEDNFGGEDHPPDGRL